jgi:ketosteroid isomerase-like protein
MRDVSDADMRAIEDLHERDVAATKLGDFDMLASMMDDECVVMPPDEDPQPGREYLLRLRATGDVPSEEIVQLVQDWQEVVLLGGHAYECGVVRSAVRGADGEVVRNVQRLMRILRRQPNGTWRVLRAMWHAPRLVGDAERA